MLFDGDRASFSYDVTMTASTQVGDQTISFKVDDDNNRSASADVFIAVNADPASITYNGNTKISGITPGSLVSLDLDVTKGTFPMNTIAVYEDGELISDP